MYENRKYVIFNTTELNKIDFNEVQETSSDTVRKSVDGTKTFVKWEGEMPASVASLTSKENTLTHQELLSVLSTEEWNSPVDNK